jgi:hypothetical protein
MKFGQRLTQEDLPSTSSLVPDGEYQAQITKIEEKETKDGTGVYLNFSLTILGPSQQGRVVFDMLNMINSSEKAVEIARSRLGDIMRATGVVGIEDTDELIGCTCLIKVGTIPEKGDYPAKNKITSYKALSVPQVSKQAFTPPTAKPALKENAPWGPKK